MKDGAGRLMRVVALPALLSLTASANAALVELKAVAVNGAPLGEPAAKVNIQPGDEVTAEILISDWAGDFERLAIWQAEFAGRDGSVSGDSGTVLPKGWPNFPEMGAFQDLDDPDWIHSAFDDAIAAVDTQSLDLRYGSLLLSSDGTLDNGSKFYGGTLILVASQDACGAFTWAFAAIGTNTFVGPDISTIVGPDTIPLEINVACLPRIINSCADNCAVDARYPHDPQDPGFSRRWDTVNLRVDGVDAASLVCSDFLISFAGGTPILLSCLFVNSTGSDTVRVVLNNTIPTTRWTCLQLRDGQPGADETCLASLPGDSNADLRSDGGDLLALIGHLTEGTPMEPWQCDIDRDGSCNQLDMLALADLLTGANQFVPWLGATISVACPTASNDAPCGDLTLPQ